MEAKSLSGAVGFSMKLRLFEESGEIWFSGDRAANDLDRRSQHLLLVSRPLPIHIQWSYVIVTTGSSRGERFQSWGIIKRGIAVNSSFVHSMYNDWTRLCLRFRLWGGLHIVWVLDVDKGHCT